MSIRIKLRPRWVGLVLVAAVIAAIAILIIRESPDRTVTGRVTSVERRKLCVRGDGGGATTCATLDSPADAPDRAVGDCVRMKYSPQGFLVALVPSDACLTVGDSNEPTPAAELGP